MHFQPFFLIGCLNGGHHFIEQIEKADFILTRWLCIHFGQRELHDVFDNPRQFVCVRIHPIDHPMYTRRRRGGEVFTQCVEITEDHLQRRAQLVRKVRERLEPNTFGPSLIIRIAL
jgi:hypothetical protein